MLWLRQDVLVGVPLGLDATRHHGKDFVVVCLMSATEWAAMDDGVDIQWEQYVWEPLYDIVYHCCI